MYQKEQQKLTLYCVVYMEAASGASTPAGDRSGRVLQRHTAEPRTQGPNCNCTVHSVCWYSPVVELRWLQIVPLISPHEHKQNSATLWLSVGCSARLMACPASACLCSQWPRMGRTTTTVV